MNSVGGTSVTPVTKELRQKDREIKAILGNTGNARLLRAVEGTEGRTKIFVARFLSGCLETV